MMKVFSLLTLFLATHLGFADHHLIETCNQKVEYVTYQADTEQSTAFLLLHGARCNGLHGFSQDHFTYWTDKGYAVSAISIPGFGKSSGPKDFCGPVTMQSLHFTIEKIKENLRASDLVVIGFGQGASVAALLASQRDDLRAVICANGCYDLLNTSHALRLSLKDKGYAIDIDNEESLRERSALYYADKISAPLFVIHRDTHPDAQISPQEAQAFYDALCALGKECCIAINPNPESVKISYSEMLTTTQTWLENLLMDRPNATP